VLKCTLPPKLLGGGGPTEGGLPFSPAPNEYTDSSSRLESVRLFAHCVHERPLKTKSNRSHCGLLGSQTHCPLSLFQFSLPANTNPVTHNNNNQKTHTHTQQNKNTHVSSDLRPPKVKANGWHMICSGICSDICTLWPWGGDECCPWFMCHAARWRSLWYRIYKNKLIKMKWEIAQRGWHCHRITNLTVLFFLACDWNTKRFHSKLYLPVGNCVSC